MIPLKDNIPSRTRPFINYTLIAVCALVFLAQLADPAATIVERYGMVPARVSDPDRTVYVTEQQAVRDIFGRVGIGEVQRPLEPAGVPAWLTLLTCIFLHGGWMHFLGNMWFLWIFGDNVEDRFGHLGYLVFYLAMGVAASLAHYVSAMDSTIPTIGASGAIAGVMGAYMFLYPKAKVLTVVPVIVFLEILVLPAPLFLGFWFLIQLFQATVSIGDIEAAGVAWWAHIGGFAAGALVAAVLGRTHHLRPKVEIIEPGSDRVRMFRYEPRRRPPPW